MRSTSTSAARAGWLCCRLLPTPPNSTPQPASLKRLSGGLRGVASGVLGGRMHLPDVGMPEGPDPPVEALQELVAVCFTFAEQRQQRVPQVHVPPSLASWEASRV